MHVVAAGARGTNAHGQYRRVHSPWLRRRPRRKSRVFVSAHSPLASQAAGSMNAAGAGGAPGAVAIARAPTVGQKYVCGSECFGRFLTKCHTSAPAVASPFLSHHSCNRWVELRYTQLAPAAAAVSRAVSLRCLTSLSVSASAISLPPPSPPPVPLQSFLTCRLQHAEHADAARPGALQGVRLPHLLQGPHRAT
jgi:hypothetical protein